MKSIDAALAPAGAANAAATATKSNRWQTPLMRDVVGIKPSELQPSGHTADDRRG
jgi:hypothetical protein